MRKAPPRNWPTVPYQTFRSEQGAVEISRGRVTIFGSLEGAAKAFAEELLSKNLAKATYFRNPSEWTYFETVWATCTSENNKYTYTIDLLMPEAMDEATWKDFKKYVEKICNNLTAYL